MLQGSTGGFAVLCACLMGSRDSRVHDRVFRLEVRMGLEFRGFGATIGRWEMSLIVKFLVLNQRNLSLLC